MERLEIGEVAARAGVSIAPRRASGYLVFEERNASLVAVRERLRETLRRCGRGECGLVDRAPKVARRTAPNTPKGRQN
ncbi:MAG: hypothetical protein BGO98_13520 [Myxococcales bacterium 68-20]|nr:hypothetical protein [Myxococcales bacterium]OJY17159.1 MAG: hypothetical protein BGO98_13520 [Myxococcales bacterium 68-20]